MTAVVAAAIAATLVICRGEDHQTVVEIKVAGPDLWPGDSTLLGTMKFHDALATDAGFVAQFRGNLRDEFIRNGHRFAPARTFVGRGGAEAAIIRPVAQRTMLRSMARWRTGGIMAGVSHENQARLRRAMMSAPTPRNASESVVGSGTATTASISDLPLNTSMRTELMLPSATLLPRPSCAQEMS